MGDPNYDPMIERACRALLIERGDDPDVEVCGMAHWILHVADVRAIVSSLREPNVHVTHAARPFIYGYEHMRSAYEAWRAGVDAILAEPTP